MFVKTADNIEIYYEVQGPEAAPCIVFAHGAGGNAASWWQQVPHFAKDYRVITFDHRGFARSKCSAEQFSAVQFEKDVLAILDQENIQKTAIVCQSMGGWTGVRLAAFHPERVSCLLLGNTPGAIFTEELLQNMRKLPLGPDAPPVASLAISAEFRTRWPEGGGLYQSLNDMTVVTPPINKIMEREAFLTEADIEKFSTPTIIISSDLDTIFPQALLEATAVKISAEIVHVLNSGHSTYFEQPESFNDIVSTFLEQFNT